MEVKCDMCFTIVKRKTDLAKHKRSEICKKIHNIIETIKKENDTKINKLQDNFNNIKNKSEKEKEDYKLLLIENNNMKNKILTLEIQLKESLIKYEDLRKIVEKAATKSTNTFKNKEDILNDNMFQIDINVNNKQLNKTKYKNIPEEIVKNDIQSLKLKDNYQLEYREEDGYINITNLCKAGGKLFADWSRLKRTDSFKQILSSTMGIPIVELLKQEQGGNNERHTWSHPQVAINIAQWISPEFDVLVSKWVYEIMLTGKVDVKDNKSTQELDTMNKENKLLKNRIKLLESKVLQKQPRETYEENKNVVYIVTTEYKEAQGYYKIGKAQDLKKRMSVYNTTDKHEVIYSTSCTTKKKMDLLEQIVHDRLENKRVEPNKEWFVSEEDAEDFIKVIEELKKVINY
jgi:hypothetical protein